MAHKKVSIRAFNEGDIPNKVKWVNDRANNKHLHYDTPLEEGKTRAWFQKSQGDTGRYDAVVEYGGRPIGLVGLLSICGGQAEYYAMIGEPLFKGRGLVAEATKLLFGHAYGALKIREVYLFTDTGNIAAQNAFEKIGFKRCGIEQAPAPNRGKLGERYRYWLDLEAYMTKRVLENSGKSGGGARRQCLKGAAALPDCGPMEERPAS